MTPDTEQEEAMIYASHEPNVGALQSAFDSCLLDLDEYFYSCHRAYEDRRNIWDGKSNDLRKHGPNAFPWQGASDMEVNVTGERIDTYVALLDQALDRSHIKAFPTSHATVGRAATVSNFLKWMRKSYIPDFRKHMERGANYLLEKGLMITYVGWKKETRTSKQTVTLDQLAELMPDLASLIASGEDDKMAVDTIMDAFPEVLEKRAKKAVRDLRKTGVAEVVIPTASVDCPIVNSCAPDGEVLFPSWVTDPQRSPYVFWRTFMTPQELEKKVVSEGWDEKWVQYAIDNLQGTDSAYLDGQYQRKYNNLDRNTSIEANELIMVVYAFQRLIDDEDGSEGIYCTVFHPDTESVGYAKHELLNGYDDYPFVVTRLSNDQGRMYETRNMCDILRGPHWAAKVERDSRIDRASLATLPPIMHPTGRPPTEYGPARFIPYRRAGELQFGPTPPPDSGSERIEAIMLEQADRAVGLDMENPLSQIRQQFITSKFLDHVRDVLSFAYKLYTRMGPDEVFFVVTGNPNPQQMKKGEMDDKFDIVVNFDSRENDPENVKSQMESMAALMQIDRNGRIDVDKLLELLSASISPHLADYVLQPAEEAQDKMLKDITDDLSKIYAGIEVPARPNGAGMAMQLVQAYLQQPDIQQRMQQDEAFAARVTKYGQQYQMILMQQQNAVTGRIGTAPAQMGGAQTQAMQQ